MWNQVNRKGFPLYICTSVNYLVTINKNSPVHLKKTSEQACMPVSKLITYSCLVHNNYNLYFSQVQIFLKSTHCSNCIVCIYRLYILGLKWASKSTHYKSRKIDISNLTTSHLPPPFHRKIQKPSSSQLCMRFDWHFYEYEIMNHSQNMI